MPGRVVDADVVGRCALSDCDRGADSGAPVGGVPTPGLLVPVGARGNADGGGGANVPGPTGPPDAGGTKPDRCCCEDAPANEIGGGEPLVGTVCDGGASVPGTPNDGVDAGANGRGCCVGGGLN